jgi:hypothetical protein
MQKHTAALVSQSVKAFVSCMPVAVKAGEVRHPIAVRNRSNHVHADLH